jgi:hypothetical protein
MPRTARGRRSRQRSTVSDSHHHRAAWLIMAAMVLLNVAAGLLFAAVEHISGPLGMYWAVSTASTVGYGDVTPHTDPGHIVAVATMITMIPLFSLFTARLTAHHVMRSEHRIKTHLEEWLAEAIPKGREPEDA